MNGNLTEIVFILDRSGSMAGLEDDTIGGFNAMVEKQKKELGEAVLSAVLFSNDNTVIYDRTDIRKVEPLTDRQYFVGGCTAHGQTVFCGWLHGTPGRYRWCSSPHRKRPQVRQGRRPAGKDRLRHHNRRHGKCQPPLQLFPGTADGKTAAGEVWMGVPIPWREHGCNLCGEELWHP